MVSQAAVLRPLQALHRASRSWQGPSHTTGFCFVRIPGELTPLQAKLTRSWAGITEVKGAPVTVVRPWRLRQGRVWVLGSGATLAGLHQA